MKQLRQFLATLLVLALLIQLVPATVFATDSEAAAEPEITEESIPDVAEEAAPSEEILFELTELREANVKHFRLDNGAYVAVAYDSPVHYQDSQGQWQEYDNTLTAVGTGGEISGYCIENGGSTRLFAADARDDGLMYVSRGDYSISLSPWREETGASLSGSGNLHQGVEAAIAPATILTAAAPVDTGEDDSLAAQMQPQKFYSALEYTGAFAGADLRYENYGATIKESIVIPAPQERYSYAFRLGLEELEPSLEADGSISLRSPEGDIIYTIPAPYMIDANDAFSTEAYYTLEEETDCWRLTVTADADWMNSEDRAFPVMLDPTIEEDTGEDLDISAAYTSETYKTSVMSDGVGGLYLGYNGTTRSTAAGNGAMRCYFHVNDISSNISIPEGCEITNATFSIYHVYHYTGGTTTSTSDALNVGLYALTAVNDWTTWADTLTWNTAATYCPFNDVIIDQQTMTNGTTGGDVTFDITNLARSWYADEASNLGFVLKSVSESSDTAYAVLHGPTKTWGRPSVTITYRNTVGLEDYYTYQSCSIGRAGSVLLSDYSLQSTLAVPLISSPSQAESFALGLYYNSAYGRRQFTAESTMLHTKSFTNMVLGAGWKLSAQQTVVSRTVGGATYLVYTDADGTEHYFKYSSSSGVYEDEDGLGLYITVSGSNYTMKDLYDNTKYFSGGYLTWETDAYGNKITYTYNSSKQLTTITRLNTGSSSTETLATFTYTNGKLTSVADEAGRVTSFAYTTVQEIVCLTEITFPDGAKAQYTYFNSTSFYKRARMQTAYDAEANCGIEFSYSLNQDVANAYSYVISNGAKDYVSKMHGYKRAHGQTVYRFYGDDLTSGTTDDILQYAIFDTMGRTINRYQTDSTEQHMLGVVAADYSVNAGTARTNNRLTAGALAGQQGVDLLVNGGAELGTGGWTNAVVSTGTVYNGAKSFSLTDGTLSQSVTLTANRIYTFSAYVNVGEDASAQLAILSGSTQKAASEIIDFDASGVNDGWVRLTLTYTPTTSASYTAAIIGTGTIYVDAAQLEQEEAASSYNFLEDSSFERAGTLSTTASGGWYRTGTVSMSTAGGTCFGSKAAYLTGSGKHHVMQKVTVNGAPGSSFLVSAWAKGAASPDSLAKKAKDADVYFGIYVRLYYEGVSTPETQFFAFDPYYDGWQYRQGIVTPGEDYADKTITAILVAVAYDNNINGACFDNVSLRENAVSAYSYDDNGNPETASSTDAGTASAVYSGVDLTQYTAPNGNVYTYAYNGKHDVTTAKATTQTAAYTYSTSGINTRAKVTGTGEAKYLQSSATAQADQNTLLSTTDANGATTSYTYSSSYNYMTSSTNANGVKTQYGYYPQTGRQKRVYLSGVINVDYAYTNARLTELARKSFRDGATQYQYYNFLYNDYGQNTQIAVGSRPLASYSYEDHGGNLTQMTYGNGNSVSYFYDALDRLVKVLYNDSTNYVEYFYNAEGALARQVYHQGSDVTTYTFEYDTSGRLIRSRVLDANGSTTQRTEHIYDNYSRLYIQRWNISGKTRSERYIYDDAANGDGSLTQLKTGSGHRINYSYDALRRLKQTSVTSSTGVELFKTAYAFATVSGNQTSTRAQFRNVRTPSGALILGYRYTYDALGNITEIAQSEGSYYPLVRYTYDDLNQLTKAVYYDGAGSAASNITATYTYTYDTAGNILSETKTAGGTTTTRTYTYGNSDWLDLLTAVNGNTITYDTSGNPLTYHNGTTSYTSLTWVQGRQLTSLTTGGKTYTYAYGADGIRTQKVVDGVVHTYVTLNGRVVRESFPYGDTTIIMDFIYDESGRPFAVCYSKNGGTSYTTYFYGVNAQGDVEKIFRILQNDETGVYEEKVYGLYTYDAWGNVTATTAAGNTPGTTTLVYRNPIRYRGYYYDNETGFYYLQSRYYDPVNRRFINADVFVSTGQGFPGCNMYAYCLNNPANSSDSSGMATDGEVATSMEGSEVNPAAVLLGGALALGFILDITTVSNSDVLPLEELLRLQGKTHVQAQEKVEPEPPDVTYPGDDPGQAPDGYEWRGPDKQGGKRGGYANPNGKDSWHPDLNHPDGIDPHWDYNDGLGHKWRVFPDHIEFVLKQ